jgi:hypothetical protein
MGFASFTSPRRPTSRARLGRGPCAVRVASSLAGSYLAPSPGGPNKKYYDPRVFIREAEITMAARVGQALADLNATGKLA